MSLSQTAVIADRSEAFLMYLSILINRLGFEALPVTAATPAGKLVRAVRPNLLILGAELDGAAPLRLLAELRGDPALVGLPIYYASANETDCEPALAAGASGFLAKPVCLDTLFGVLEQTRSTPRGPRRSPRIAYNRPVTVTWNGQTTTCQAVALSEGGMYLRRRTPFPQGCFVDVRLPLEGGELVDLEGEVLYTHDLPKDRFTLPPGMAIRFLAPSDETVGRLRRMVAESLIGDIIAEQDEPVIKG